MALSLSSRLIKGDGEVLEEIVSKERHKEINKVTGGSSPSLTAGGRAGGPTAEGLLHPEALFLPPGT